MAAIFFVEQRKGESWESLTSDFMKFCIEQKGMTRGGCHEGDSNPSEFDGLTFASVAIPDHSPDVIDHLLEWAELERRKVLPEKQIAEQGGGGQAATHAESK